MALKDPVLLHHLFEEQADLRPDSIAVKFNRSELTYSELNDASSRFAGHLRRNGVKAGDRVVLCMNRSVDLMTAILGILKAGAAYVPIDPGTPAERFEFLLDDIASPFLITGDGFTDPAGGASRNRMIIPLGGDWRDGPADPADVLTDGIDEESEAVILFTSGSTGYPKGVRLSHGALVNRLIWDRNEYGHGPEDVVLQHSSYTFDFSVLEIFMALAGGGRLVLARPDFHYDSLYLIDLIRRERITKMGSVPSLMALYLELPDFEKCASLKQVFLGGEVLPARLQKTFFEKSSAELVNIYGPTETSISVLNWVCRRDDPDGIVPIGYPVAGMRIHLLNEERRPVADGEVGELYIAGRGVAKGYHNRPELTARCFLPDPFDGERGRTMYKSGDFGKRLPDGSVQFMGRADHQIKIRGLRVELQEIEHHLSQHPAVRECAVVCLENRDEPVRIVAYLKTGGGLDIDDLKKTLQSKLPGYMIPGMFVTVDAFARSPNGKLDRKALPKPDRARLLARGDYQPPVTATQMELVRIWEKVLNLRPIGVTDAFDRLGGDSLAAVGTHVLMETEMGCSLPLSAFVGADTIRDQARIIDALDPSGPRTGLVQLTRAGLKTPVVFVPYVVGTSAIIAMALARYLDPSHPLISAIPRLDPEEPTLGSIEAYAQWYADLLRERFPHDAYILAGYSMGGLVALEMASRLSRAGKAVPSLVLIDTVHPKFLRSLRRDFARDMHYLGRWLKGEARTDDDAARYMKIRVNRIRRLCESRLGVPGAAGRSGNAARTASGPVVQADDPSNYIIARRYAPRTYSGDVLLVCTTGEGRSSNYWHRPEVLQQLIGAWAEVVQGRFDARRIPGTHSSIVSDPGIERVANIINDHILKMESA
jgi:amino acid adenylation domain-containing protein